MSTVGQSCPYSIGQRFNPLGEQLDDPYPFYAEARREEPVFFSPAFSMWIVTRYQDVRAVVANPRLFSSRKTIDPIVELCPAALAELGPGGPFPVPSLVSSDPPGHGRWRTVMNQAFSPSRMRRLEAEIREIARERVDAIAPLGRAEVMGDIAFPVPLKVIARLCDIDDEHLDDLKRWGESLVLLISSPLEPEHQVQMARDMADYRRFMAAHVARKRKEPGDDITSQLLAGGGNEPFSDEELVTQMVGNFVAGHETTTHMIGNALQLLLSEPARWQAVVDDPSLIPAAVEETLRLDTSVPTFIRTATADTVLAGKNIAAGDNVLVVFASANHDEEEFTDPESFDLHRKGKGRHMGFGHGIHSCVGAPLARIEGQAVLEALATRLPDLRLVPGQQLHHIPQLIFRGYDKLEVEWG